MAPNLKKICRMIWQKKKEGEGPEAMRRDVTSLALAGNPISAILPSILILRQNTMARLSSIAELLKKMSQKVNQRKRRMR